METKQYQELASRTECDQAKSRRRMASAERFGQFDGTHHYAEDPTNLDPEYLVPIRVNHAVVGLSGEVGELASILQKWIYYGKEYSLDDIRLLFTDELGDVLWYVALAMNALGLDMGEVMEANIRKLACRYPDRYTDTAAAEENRDRAKEADALAQVVEGSVMKSLADAAVTQGLSAQTVCTQCGGSGQVSCEWSTELTDCPVCVCPAGGFHHWYSVVSSVGSGRVCLRCRKTEPG